MFYWENLYLGIPELEIINSVKSTVAHFFRSYLACCVHKILFVPTMDHHHGKSASFQIGAKFELLSHPLQVSIRFFQVPIPSKPSSTLRLSTP